jgi:hypothetical protein
MAFAVGCGGGTEGGSADELDIEGLWVRVQEADADVTSMHMEIAGYYENTQFGGGQIQSIILDFNSEDFHEQQILLGQVYYESIRAGDRLYVKDMDTDTWEEVPAEASSDTASEYTSQFLELPSIAVSQERLGSETIDDEDTEHCRFVLDTEGITRLFSSQPSYDFSQSEGGEVDVWIDSDQYHLVRYDLVIRGILISDKIGYGDIRFIVNIRDINEPIEITAPI